MMIVLLLFLQKQKPVPVSRANATRESTARGFALSVNLSFPELRHEDFPLTLMRGSPDGTVEQDHYRQEILDLAAERE
jgi:hypothetical protein